MVIVTQVIFGILPKAKLNKNCEFFGVDLIFITVNRQKGIQ
jgi:hypothetical protein